MELVLRVGSGICSQGPYVPSFDHSTSRDDDCAPARYHRTICRPDGDGLLFHAVRRLYDQESLFTRSSLWSLLLNDKAGCTVFKSGAAGRGVSSTRWLTSDGLVFHLFPHM